MVQEEEVKEEPNEFEVILEQTGFQAVIHVFNNYESTKENASLFILQCSKHNAVELFTEKLQTLMPSWSD